MHDMDGRYVGMLGYSFDFSDVMVASLLIINKNKAFSKLQFVMCIGQIPQNGRTWWPCPPQWGSYYYMFSKMSLIDGLYSMT